MFISIGKLKYLRTEFPSMDTRIISLSLVLCTIFFAAGCLSPEKPEPTPTPTAVPTIKTTTMPASVPTTKASTIPGPTDTLPPQWPLSFTVEKAGTYSTTIITHFDGGKGLMYITRMDVRVTHPDGIILTNGLEKPKMGDTVEVAGTSGTDRVEVLVTMANGGVYKVIDQQMIYKSKGN